MLLKNFAVTLALVSLTPTYNLNNQNNVNYSFDNGNVVVSNDEYFSIQNNLSKYIIGGEESNISGIYEVFFANNEQGYFVTFDDLSGNSLESVLVRGEFYDYSIVAIYPEDCNPIGENNRYYKDALTFVSTPIVNTYNSALVGTADYTTGVTFGSTTSPSNYLPISNVSDHLYTYTSSYLNEVRILNVPNYMNTQFSNSGCSPTTAAMYFAYLEDNGYPIFTTYQNLPIMHTENTSMVNTFIYNLGNNYFNKSPIYGTSRLQIPVAYETYFNTCGYNQYDVTVSNNYNEFYNSIANCALPVHVSLTINEGTSNEYYHSVLGIGIRDIFDGTSTDRFIVTNYASNNTMDVVSVSLDEIAQFYFIYR